MAPSRQELKTLAQDFLKTYGWLSKPASGFKDALLFSRPTGMGVTDELLVYFHEKGEEGKLDGTLQGLANTYERIPAGENGRRFVLSNAPLGVTTSIKENGFKYQVPVWFFDREISSTWVTPLKSLEDDVRKYEGERVPQPFESDGHHGEDLLKHLLRELQKPKERNITLIIAPAGYGKTVLMSGLYTKLRERFIQAKAEQRSEIRPLMMLPGHVMRADDLESLVNNFINAEYEYGVASVDAFRFWVRHGFAVWLLDGLEELILKSPEIIYQLLDDYIYPSDKTPQIVISIRKPLLVASPELREAINEWSGSGVTVYNLSEWGDAQKENYFRKNLSRGENVAAFIEQIKRGPTLRSLCNVPYYCSLITDLKNENRMKVFNDDTELVEYAFERICEREFTKGLDEQICPLEKQKELFSILALESFRPDGKLDRAYLREWAEVELPSELATDIKEDQLNCLERHAVLSIAGESIDFIHDIVKQFLVASALKDELCSNILNEFASAEIEVGSFIYKYLATRSADCEWSRVLFQLKNLKGSPQAENRSFRNILNIYLSTDLEKKEEVLGDFVSNTNLSGLVFRGLNLTEFNFHNSKLNATEFRSCNLTKAEFDGCDFKETLFSNDSILVGASIKDTALESIRVESRQMYDQKEIRRFFFERTQLPQDEIHSPCQAAVNLRKVFEKLVRRGKGFKIPTNFLANTKLGGGTQAANIVAAALKQGYLTQEGARSKVRINLYEEVGKFIKNFGDVTPGLREILNSVCTDMRIGCRHV